MLKYLKTFEDEVIVRYTYKPWGKGQGGTVEFNKENDDVIKMERAKTDKFGRYMGHMISELHRMNKQKQFKNNGEVAWG